MNGLPDSIIIDLEQDVHEFLNTVRYGCEYTMADFLILEEIVAAISYSLIVLNRFENDLNKSIKYYYNNGSPFTNYTSNIIFAEAMRKLAFALFNKLEIYGVFVNGVFPYIFNRMYERTKVIFSYAPELFNDNYIPSIGEDRIEFE